MKFIKRVLGFFLPPEQWRLAVLIVSAIFLGLVFYLMHISRFTSYLSDDAEACVNCHIMTPQYASWVHSAHREVTNCNSCHVPHDNIFNTYYFKAKDGMRHATIYTMRAEPQVIFIKPAGVKVVQENCVRCHHETVLEDRIKVNYVNHYRTDRLCWDCHRHTPHGRVNSLASTPHARVPLPGSPVPEWLRKLINK
jgi:cytochrome c nitrite reductase small subunit